jgi:hypothetical protein
MIKEIKNAVTIPRHGEGPYWTPSSLISEASCALSMRVRSDHG